MLEIITSLNNDLKDQGYILQSLMATLYSPRISYIIHYAVHVQAILSLGICMLARSAKSVIVKSHDLRTGAVAFRFTICL